jgi:hypothetical protein
MWMNYYKDLYNSVDDSQSKNLVCQRIESIRPLSRRRRIFSRLAAAAEKNSVKPIAAEFVFQPPPPKNIRLSRLSCRHISRDGAELGGLWLGFTSCHLQFLVCDLC